jgi:hypothetical protein
MALPIGELVSSPTSAPELEMTGWYMKQIPETVRAAVEKMDADICKIEAPKPERGGSIQ